MGLTQNELDAVLATGGTPKKGDSVEQLLAKLAIQTAPAIAHYQITDSNMHEFAAGYHYSVAIVSGTAVLERPPVGEAEPVGVELTGIATGRFTSATYTKVTAGSVAVVVIEQYAA